MHISTRPRQPWISTVAGVAIVAILLFPLYWMVANSLQTNEAIFRTQVPLIPRSVTPAAYGVVFRDQLPHLLVSLVVSLSATVVSLLVAVPAGYALAHFRFRFTLLLVLCLLTAQMIPTVTLATPMFLIFNRLGLLNTYGGLILADTTYAVPFDILILRAFFQSVPYDLVEAAFVDGAGEWAAFARVMLPVAQPGVVTAGLFAFLFAWGDFLYALTIMTTGDIQPISLSLYNYLGQFHAQWNDLMAVATLAAIPAALLLAAFQRSITSGMTAGAVKG